MTALDNAELVTVGTIWRQRWQARPAKAQRRWRFATACFTFFWLAGAWYAPRTVDGIARLDGVWRLLCSLCMGGFAFFWRWAEASGRIQESLERPSLLWMLLAAVVPGLIIGLLFLASQPANPQAVAEQMTVQLAHEQGRLTAEEARQKFTIRRGIPLARASQKSAAVGMPFGTEGHALVVAPTRGGKVRRVTAQ